MLTISFEKLAYIIAKAREFAAEVPPVDEDSGSKPSDDAERDVLEFGADNPTYQELIDAIESLSDWERIELLALAWLGRGDYAKEEWAMCSGKHAASTTKRRPNTWSARRCSPTTSRKDCRSWVTRSRISRPIECSPGPLNQVSERRPAPCIASVPVTRSSSSVVISSWRA